MIFWTHSYSYISSVMNPVCSTMSNLWSCLRKYSVMKQTGLLRENSYYLRRRQTIYRASDCPHMGMSLHGLWCLTVHIRACHCMGCDVWLSTYGHVIAWAVTSDCPHTGKSLHGLWRLTVHIRARHCMGCDVWLSTYGHVIAWAVTSDCPHTGTSLHGLWRLTVHIRACHCMGCDVWLSTYGHVIAWAVTSLHGDYGGKRYYYSSKCFCRYVLLNSSDVSCQIN